MYAVSSVKWGVVHDAEVNKNRLEGETKREREKDGGRGRGREGGRERANNTYTCAYLNVYFFYFTAGGYLDYSEHFSLMSTQLLG